RLGYSVPAIVTSGEEALKITEQLQPDLILMDILLQGSMDGIDAAHKIRERTPVPIVYLSASSDPATSARMKVTEPAGLVVKPFKEGELRTVIEIALYKNELDKKLRESQEWLSVTLHSISDAILAASPQGTIRFLNPVCEQLIGWSREDAVDQDILSVIGEDQ